MVWALQRRLGNNLASVWIDMYLMVHYSECVSAPLSCRKKIPQRTPNISVRSGPHAKVAALEEGDEQRRSTR
jgi:hypothetical protein